MAIVVGIDKYASDSGFGPLTYAANDAKDLFEVLKAADYRGPDDQQTYPILDAEATGTRILKEIDKAIKLLNGRGTLVFFFSGHGTEDAAGKQYLAPYEIDLDRLERTGVSIEEIVQKLKTSSIPRKVLLIDACREPKIPPGTKGPPVPPPPFFSKYLSARGLLTFYASSPGTPSYEDLKLGHGIFSKYLIDGLRGKAQGLNGLVTFTTLTEFVKKSVAQVRQDQVPTVSTENQSEDFILGGKLENPDLPVEFSQEELVEGGKIYYAARHSDQAKTLAAQGKPEEARKHFDVALHLQPGDVDARMARVGVSTQLRDADSIRSDCQEAAASAPKSDDIRAQCGQALAKIDWDKSAAEWYTEAIQLSPANWVYYAHRAEGRGGLGQFDLALADWRKARELNDAPPAWVVTGEARALAGLGQTGQALAIVNKQGIDAGNIDLAVDLLFDQGKGGEALKNVAYRIALTPTDPVVYFDACTARVLHGELESGLLQCRIGLELAGDKPLALAELGLGQVLAHRDVDSRKTGERFLSLFNRDPKHTLRAANQGAILFNLLGNYDQALNLANEATRLEPEVPSPLRHKAYALWKLGRSPEARALLDQLIAEHSGYALAYRTRSQVRASLGDTSGAEADEKKAAQLHAHSDFY